MPTYQYLCKKCGHQLEELQSISAPPLVRCPKCHTDNLARAMGAGAGLIFKGSGFYQTDYKKKSGARAKEGSSSKGKKDVPAKDQKEGTSTSSPPAKDTSGTNGPSKSD